MGGNALTTPARRIQNAHYDLLYAHCLSRLMTAPPSGLFRFTSCSRPRHFITKPEHGDLDLICAWAGVGTDGLKGRETGKVSYPSESKRGKAVVQMDEMREWCEDIVRDLQGTEWVRNGGVLDIAVPVEVIDPSDTLGGFYQVDVILTPASSYTFFLTLYGYSWLIPVFSTMVGRYSRSLVLRERALCIKHTAYPGLPAIDFVLCTDLGGPRGVFTYFGMDEGFVTRPQMNDEDELWAWLADCSDDSRGAKILKRLARPGPHIKPLRNRPESVERFRAYLKTTHWAPPPLETPDPAEALAALSISSSSSTPSTPPIQPPLDPANPVPLDADALDALVFWGKEKEYATHLARLRIEAESLAARRKPKVNA